MCINGFDEIHEFYTRQSALQCCRYCIILWRIYIMTYINHELICNASHRRDIGYCTDIAKCLDTQSYYKCYKEYEHKVPYCANLQTIVVPRGTLLFCYNKSKRDAIIPQVLNYCEFSDGEKSNPEIIAKMDAFQRYFGLFHAESKEYVYFTENWQCFFTFVPFLGGAIKGFSNDYTIVNVYVTTTPLTIACLVLVNDNIKPPNILNRYMFRNCDCVGKDASYSPDSKATQFDPYIPIETRRSKFAGFMAVTMGDSFEHGSAKKCIQYNKIYPEIYKFMKYHLVSDTRDNVHGFIEIAIPPLKFSKTILIQSHSTATDGTAYRSTFNWGDFKSLITSYDYTRDGNIEVITKKNFMFGRLADTYNFDLLVSLQNLDKPVSRNVNVNLDSINQKLSKILTTSSDIFMDCKTGFFIHRNFIEQPYSFVIAKAESFTGSFRSGTILCNVNAEPTYSLIKYFKMSDENKIEQVDQKIYSEIFLEYVISPLVSTGGNAEANYHNNKKKYTDLLMHCCQR